MAENDWLKAPFPYFGGKSKIAPIVWQALGNVNRYIEPFFGSGAVLLSRPNYDPKVHREIVNDKDGFVANVWRALQHDPDQVAKYCDWPVNHADLSARRRRLIDNEGYLLKNLIEKDDWYDAKLAGYWIWATSCWIGSGLTRKNHQNGICKRPDIARYSMGIHKKSVCDINICKRPNIGNSGIGIHKLSLRDNEDSAKLLSEPFNNNIYYWFRKLAERLRYVTVVCGDWTRVCNGNWQDFIKPVGIYFDPPYGTNDRDVNLYHHDSLNVAQDVMKWCLERGDNPNYRIVLSGYDEHKELLNHGWSMKPWKNHGGYAHTTKKFSRGKENRLKEVIYFSPHCLNGLNNIFEDE